MTESLYYMGLISKAEGNKIKAKEYFEKANSGNITALSTLKRTEIEKELNEI